MVKKKVSKKKANKSSNNFNRNLFVGAVILILIFVVAFNFAGKGSDEEGLAQVAPRGGAEAPAAKKPTFKTDITYIKNNLYSIPPILKDIIEITFEWKNYPKNEKIKAYYMDLKIIPVEVGINIPENCNIKYAFFRCQSSPPQSGVPIGIINKTLDDKGNGELKVICKLKEWRASKPRNSATVYRDTLKFAQMKFYISVLVFPSMTEIGNFDFYDQYLKESVQFTTEDHGESWYKCPYAIAPTP